MHRAQGPAAARASPGRYRSDSGKRRKLQDALSEVNIVKKLEEHLDAPPAQVKVRCRQCQTLNDETSKFCNQCGAEL